MLYQLTTLQFSKMLTNLSAFLQKSAAHADTAGLDMDALLQARLAPDQFPLVRQVQIACDTAKLGVARLTAKEAPSHPDTEKTLPELLARIQATLAYLETISEADFANAKTRAITQPRWEGKHLTGEAYVLHHVVPNFYFHVTTAYSILRHNGVDVGKKDYLGKMPFVD